MENWIWLIQLIASLGAAAAAIVAWRSVKETRKAARAQVFMQIVNYYS